MAIPISLTDSAEIDGANQLTIITRVVLPLSIPAMVTLSLFYAVGHWNQWWDAYLFVSVARKQPVQLILRNLLAQTTVLMDPSSHNVNVGELQPPSRSVQNAAIVITTLPIVLAYPFVQKYFIKGMMMGSIKG